MTTTHEFWLAGRRASGDGDFEVHNPWDGRLVGRVAVPTEAQVEEAVAAAVTALPAFAATPRTCAPPHWTTWPSAWPSAPRRSPG